MTQSVVSAQEVQEFYATMFQGRGTGEEIEEVRADYARLRRQVGDNERRPGGYISGPTQMGLADSAAYVAVFTRTGIAPMAVTSTLNINFMRPCIGEAVIAEARLLKLGKTLAVIEVEIRAEGDERLSSHAVVNYSIPFEE